MASNAKNFLVSTADFALYFNDKLVCTGTTNMNTSLEVSMEEQVINAGKGNKRVYSYKYGRELAATLEAADWKLEYVAANIGNDIKSGLEEVYHIDECVDLTEGVGMLSDTPVGKVAVTLPNGVIVEVDADDKSIDLKSQETVKTGTVSVKATYRYNRQAKSLTIDADTSPKVYKLVLDAERHNNKLGKVGSLQVIIPSYQPSGNFTMEFTPDGVTSTNIDGNALAVEGDTCAGGGAVYAYIKEFDTIGDGLIDVAEIAVSPSQFTLAHPNTQKLSIIGIRGGAYSNIEIDPKDCTYDSSEQSYATVENGVVTSVAAGKSIIKVTYKGVSDIAEVTVTGE